MNFSDWVVKTRNILRSIGDLLNQARQRVKEDVYSGKVGAKNLGADIGYHFNRVAEPFKEAVHTPVRVARSEAETNQTIERMHNNPSQGTIRETPNWQVRYGLAKEAGAENTVPTTEISTGKAMGSSAPSQRSTKVATVVPKRMITPTKVAPSISDIEAGIRNIQAGIGRARAMAAELARTQPPAPSTVRKEAGITPPPPISKAQGGKPTATPAIETSAIRSYHRSSIPTPPEVERVPLARRQVVARVPKSAILRELKRARSGRPGYVLTPEGRPLEARPRRKLKVSV